MPAVALALDAKMVLRSARNSRIVSADAFFLGLYSTVLEPDEFLEEVRFDPQSRNEGSAFVEVSARKGDFAFVGAAARIIMDKARCSMVRLVYSGIDGRPTRISQAEVAITGSSATLETFERAAAIASAIANPPSSFQAPSEYRKDLVRALTVQALLDASRRCREGE
jgi:carbon-monoxide dehydrogenase medium subunit